jgi:protein kinase-like protein
MALQPGTRLGAYDILGFVGAGGMGEVYRARDLRLGRDVAIKVLPADRVADEGRRRRFVQEAQAASALNHPHIITICEIDTAEANDFIVMEYVRGKSLDGVGPQGVYYVPCDPTSQPSVHVMNLETDRGQRLGTLDGLGWRPLGLAVSSDGKTILYPKVTTQNADLMLIENFR